MNHWKLAALLMSLAIAGQGFAQDIDVDDIDVNIEYDAEDLKLVALEALMAAPSDKALPTVLRLLDSDESEDLKEAALFILSQIDDPAAHEKLLAIARDADDPLRADAVRMIGIGSDDETLAALADLYRGGDEELREAVLEAYLIAGDEAAVYELAANASTNEEFEAAVEILGAMGARDQLRKLRDRPGSAESLIEAYAIAGDFESLDELARDSSDLERQGEAIQALGIIGGDKVDAALVEIYRGSDSDYIREAALDGLLIAGHDEGVLQLYRATDSIHEKRMLLETLSVMDSDLLYEVIDEALAGDQ